MHEWDDTLLDGVAEREKRFEGRAENVLRMMDRIDSHLAAVEAEAAAGAGAARGDSNDDDDDDDGENSSQHSADRVEP